MREYVELHIKLDRIIKDLSVVRRKLSLGEKIHVRVFVPENVAMEKLQKSKKSLQLMRRAGIIRFTSVKGRNIQYCSESIDEILAENSSN